MMMGQRENQAVFSHFRLNAFWPIRMAHSDHSAVCLPSNALRGHYPKAKIRPNEDGKVYNFAHPGRQPGNPGYLKSEAATYPSEPLP